MRPWPSCRVVLGKLTDLREARSQLLDIPWREQETVDPVSDEVRQGHRVSEDDWLSGGQRLQRRDRLKLGGRGHTEERAALVGVHELLVADLAQDMDAVGDAEFGSQFLERLFLVPATDDVGFESERRISLRERFDDVGGVLL